MAQAEKETAVPAAYEAFLRGLEHYRRTTAEDYAKAVPYFEEAIRLDPSYARAYAALAIVYARSAARGYIYALGISEPDATIKARHYLREAEKRPTALSHQAAGHLLFRAEPVSTKALTFQKAIALDPGDPWNYVLVGRVLTAKGQAADAVHISARACGSTRTIRKHSSSISAKLCLAQNATRRPPTPWREHRSSTRTMTSYLPCSAPPTAFSAARKMPNLPSRASTSSGSSAAQCR